MGLDHPDHHPGGRDSDRYCAGREIFEAPGNLKKQLECGRRGGGKNTTDLRTEPGKRLGGRGFFEI